MNPFRKTLAVAVMTLLVLSSSILTALAQEGEIPPEPTSQGVQTVTTSNVPTDPVVVTKKVYTSFTRTYYWTIDKSADQSALTLAAGQQVLVNYSVTVNLAGYTDGNWVMYGGVNVRNYSDQPITVISVSDVVSPGIGVPLTCEYSLPFTIPVTVPGGEFALPCSYNTPLPDGSPRLNTATATLADGTQYTGSASVVFGTPSTEIDECIEVYDTFAGSLGTVCAGVDLLPKTFTYSRWVGPFTGCGNFTVDNTASFTTKDTGATGSDSWTVNVTVPCGGCTLTPGYWKTHSRYGPAPYDDTWALIGEDTPFFLSGQSWYQVLWTEPRGNAYYLLAHAYIAAQLNAYNGADTSAVTVQLGLAASRLGTYSPAQIGALKGSDALRQEFISLAGILDSFNNGYIGPGHCSE